MLSSLRDSTTLSARRRAAGAGMDIWVFRRLSLAGQFVLASLLVFVVGTIVIGTWVGRQIEHDVLDRTATAAALLVNSVISNDVQSLATGSSLTEPEVAALDRVLAETPLGEQIAAFKVWSPDGTVVYSPNRELIGRRFDEIRPELARSLRGEVTADDSDLSAPENALERQRWDHLVEVYVPVRDEERGRIIAVTEFYQLPFTLDREVAAGKRQAWAVVTGVMLGVYLLLAGIVRRGSNTIANQQTILQSQVAELSRLLDQNAQLHTRVMQAAGRTTTLNEQALRRISADLHDGPGQALALALLRLKALRSTASAESPQSRDFSVVHSAVHDALNEIREISAGLRLPQLAPLSIGDVAARAVRDHEHRTGKAITLETGELPAEAPLPVKMALFRSLQESLSNAHRHGGGDNVVARVWTDADMLHLSVSDQGPGFDPNRVAANGHLGLAGMRERCELLGGSFTVDSQPGEGTTINACWPIGENDDDP